MFSRKRNDAVRFLGVAVLPLSLLPASAALAQNPSTTVSVDVNANRRAIDPRIYGIAHASQAAVADLNAPLNRHGGNNTSRYNWQLNADNRGSDWYFQSIADASATAGERLDTFINATRNAGVGAQPMVTIPMIGYVAKVGANRAKLASFSIQKYGAQTGNDWQWFPDAGNGILLSTGQPVVGNDPLDANVTADSTFQQNWVQHLVTRWGLSSGNGVKYYIYDNEHSLWHHTHRDVKPTGATMDEIKNKMIDYGNKIRAKDSGALLVGPEEWGWSGYFYSGYDQQWGGKNGWGSLPDRNNHGGWDYLPWLLDQMRQYNNSTGKRLLDIFTVHYYPQGGEFSEDTSQTMQLRRNRSTRSLWDPNYVDESWIGTQVRLIPRIREWVAQYYPGTKTGITEYNWGAEGHINGATTQADILGIFGREGLDIAARWATPDASTPTYKAMKLYRNYDGNRSTFGNTSVRATVPNPDNLSSFAAVRSSDGALTIMVISKYLSGNTPVNLSLANFTAQGSVQRWQLTSSNAITRLSDISVSGTAVSTSVPAQSVTLFVIPALPNFTSSATASPSTVARNTTTRITGTFTCTAGSISNGLVNLEVYNSAGQKVHQQYNTGQTFNNGQTRSYNWNWTPTTAGTYTIKTSVFSANWATLYHWNNNAGTVTVQ